MDKRIAIPAGLALLVALAVVGVLSIFSFTATDSVEASILDTVNFDSAKVDVAKLTEPVKTPLQSTATSVISGTASHNPVKPGVAATYTFTFQTPSVLQNAVDEIVLTFDDEYGVPPSSIDRNQITISASAVQGGSGASPNQAVTPLEASVDLVSLNDSEQDEPEVTLRVPDMDPSDSQGATGSQDISAGATVTIVIRQAAGITNPTESGGDRIDVRTSKDRDDVELLANGVRVFTPVILEMGSSGDPRGDSLTLNALGVEGGQTATFWLDLNGDSVRQSSERDLCNVVATSRDIANCNVTLSNPPFIPGKFALGVDSTADINDAGGITAGDTVVTVTSPTPFVVGRVIEIDTEKMLITGIAGSVLTVERGVLGTTAATHADTTSIFTVNVNFINVVDGESRTTTGVINNALPYTGVELSRQNFELEPTLSPSPSDANVGDTITLSLFDYPAGALSQVLIGGQDVTPAGFTSRTVSGSGELSFAFKIPGTANNSSRIPTGTQRLEVIGAGGAAQDTDLTIGGARLTLSHDTIVANQDLTITGSGFSDGNNICIVEGQITVNNVAVEIDDDNDCPAAVLTAEGATEGILLTSGGTFTATVRVHDADIGSNSINTALLTEGTVEFKVIDTNGAEGTLNLEIQAREITVTPASARPRDIVTLIGRAFVADNADGVSTSVDIEYSCGTDTRSVTADPDASGNFRETLRIPSGCSIPSTNTITATIDANGTTGVVETVTHEIPEALVRVTPPRGSPGDSVVVTGEGFRTFETLESVEFGDLSVLGGRTVNTDGNGDFSVEGVIVPGEDPGIHAVKVEVGTGDNRTTSSTSFEILSGTGVEGSVATPIETALAPLFEGETLDRVFFFNNATKEWAFYINDTAFESANDLDEIPSGQPIWIKVTEDTTVELNNNEFDLSCVNAGTPEEDCWNLIVFP